jgi:hypothetical protein
MRNLVTMHQPNYLPWIGLFSKVKMCDCFVIMDTFQYTKDGVIHRNKIRTNTGTGYLTIPISKEFARAKIKDVELPSDKKWREIHWQTIYRNYIKTDFFRDYADFFEGLYHRDFHYLSEINMEIIRYLLKCFNINVEIIMASDLDIDQSLSHTDMIIAVLKNIEANSYLSGPSGKGYLEMEKFECSNLGCKFSNFTHPEYKQRYTGFEPNMAAIDLLFNMGPQSIDIINNSGRIEILIESNALPSGVKV